MPKTPRTYNLDIDENTVDLKQSLLKYSRYWSWFLVSLVLCLTLGFLYNRYAPKIYQTSAKIKILDEDKGLRLPQFESLFSRSNVNLENEIEILTSYRILEKVVDRLGLTSEFFEVGRVQTSQIDSLPFQYQQIHFIDSIYEDVSYGVEVTETGFEIENHLDDTTLIFDGHTTASKSNPLPFEMQINSPASTEELIGMKFELQIISKKAAVLKLKEELEIQTIGKESEILQLTLKGESAARSERILNTLINTFNQDGIEDRQLISRRTIDFIDDRFIFLAQELDSIEIDKQDFKQDNNLIFLDANSDLSLQERAQADEELFKIENQLALSKLLKNALDDQNSGRNLLPANIGLNNSVVNDLIGQYNDASLEREKLIISGGANNPLVRQLDATLTELRRNLDSSVEAYINQLEVSKKQYQNRNSQFRSEVYQIPEKEKLLRAIERQQAIKESLYLLLLQKREEAAISLAVTEPSIKVVEYALSDSRLVWPKTSIVIIAGLLLGICIPFLILYFKFLFDTKIHGEEDLENFSQELLTLGVIPEIKAGKKMIFNNPNDRTVLAESFRILASNSKYLLPSDRGNKGAVIYCTSANKGEGKSFVSTNLSLALSSLNKKVLLVGADLRNPQLHTYAKLGKKDKGLTNYLYDTTTQWEQFTVEGFKEHPTHSLLISGDIPVNPPQLLSNGRFQQFLKEAKEVYDYIVVDTAPTLLVTDTLLIADEADVTLYLTKANFTEKRILEYISDLFQRNKLKNPAIVINAVGNSRKGRYNYNYGYNYGYKEE